VVDISTLEVIEKAVSRSRN